MKILFVNQFYWPDVAATAQLMVDLCEDLAHQGHDITVLCSRGQYDDGTGAPTPKRETHNGVNIRRLSAAGFGKRSTLGRVIDYASFHLLCGGYLLRHTRKFDIIVTLTTPPLIGLYATWFKGKSKHVCWAMDLHPDIEFEMGLWSRRNPVWRIFDWLNGLHFRRADAVVALGGRMMVRLVNKHVQQLRIEVITPWSPGDDVQAMERSPWRDTQPWADKFVVMYSGNAGLIHTFDAVTAAMRELRDDDRFAFVFIGGGKRLAEIDDALAVKMPYQPREMLGESLAAADVHLVTLRDGMSGTAVPCKLYGIMAAARPTIYLGPADSDTAIDINQSDAGLTLATDDAAGLVAALRKLADDEAERKRLAANARTAFEQHHSRAACCRRWIDLLESLGR
ncbi:glycosyltransferase family 4 protein [Planctomycetales bacterium ZRK34]|nr:glycosyltransferase family 4 protein [Planctomycetales bacterium ZRK34]